MGLYECQVCGRKYRSAQWLSRHMDSKHGTPTAGEDGKLRATGQEQVDAKERRQPGLDEGPPEMAEHGEPLALACQALSIDVADVLSFRIYDEMVVVIEGPAGRKRVWPRKESG
jgi:hypothetical protein